jgi:NAD kinase
MRPATENKIVLVVRRTRLDELIARFNTEDQARFYVEHLGADFADYRLEDQVYKKALQQVEASLGRIGRLHVLNRTYLPNYVFGAQDTVVALGQDGLVANILKYLDGQPVFGVNPDPARWEGVLVQFAAEELEGAVQGVMTGRGHLKRVTMAEAALNTGHVLLGVNDIFIGARTHTSARYMIRTAQREEQHSSSGIIVSTGLGSTGWLRSVLAGASGIVSSASGHEVRLEEPTEFPWDAEFLRFSVREPWPSRVTGARVTFGKITHEEPLVLLSQMPENGVIFSDGIEADFVEFNSGTTATIRIASKKGLLASKDGA